MGLNATRKATGNGGGNGGGNAERNAPRYTLRLPYPPSVNHYWRRVRRRVFVSRRGRRYRKRVAEVLRARRVGTIRGPVSLRVRLHPPDRRRRDVDNALKALLDALERGGALRDDHQVVRLCVERGPVVEGGEAVVEIREVERPDGVRKKRERREDAEPNLEPG